MPPRAPPSRNNFDAAFAKPKLLHQPSTLAQKTLNTVDGLVQAALSARNTFLAELNTATVQQREVGEAARRKLEQDLATLADSCATFSDKLFFSGGGLRLPKTKPETAAPASHQQPASQQPAPPSAPSRAQPSRAPSAAASKAADDADLETEAVNLRASLAALEAEVVRLRDSKRSERREERAKFEAEQRLGEELSSTRAALARAEAERDSLVQRLQLANEQQAVLHERLHEAQVRSAAGSELNEDGYGLDSVSVAPGGSRPALDSSYDPVKRLEERVLSLSAQLAAANAAQERLEGVLRERGIAVEHVLIANQLTSTGLLRTVRRSQPSALPPDAPMKAVRAALSLAEARCAEAEEGHAASSSSLESLLGVVTAAACSDSGDAEGVMRALPALAALAGHGSAARALLAGGAAAAVAQSALAHLANAGLLCEACTTLSVLAGGALAPLSLSRRDEEEARLRLAMCDSVAEQAGPALARVAMRQAGSAWVMLGVARAVGVLARSPAAGQRLLRLGLGEMLSAALADFAGDAEAYETAAMCALALMELAASCEENAAAVDGAGGREALQGAMRANSTLARALAMEFPLQSDWLAGRAAKRRGKPLFACLQPAAQQQPAAPAAEQFWLSAVRAAVRALPPGSAQPHPSRAVSVLGSAREQALLPREQTAMRAPPPPIQTEGMLGDSDDSDYLGQQL